MNNSCRWDHRRLCHHSLALARQCPSLHSTWTASLRCSHRRMTTPHRCWTTTRLAPLHPLLISLCPPAKSLNSHGIRPCPWDHRHLPPRSLQLARQCPSLHSTQTTALRCSHRCMTTPHRCCTARHRTMTRLAALHPTNPLNRHGIAWSMWLPVPD